MKAQKIIANKDSYGFQERGWKKGDIAHVTSLDFPEAKHFDHLDGTPLVEEKKPVVKKSAAETKAEHDLQLKIKADLDAKLKEEEAKKEK